MTNDQLVRLVVGPTRYKRSINKDEVIRKQRNSINYLSKTLSDLTIRTLEQSIRHNLALLLYFFNFDKYTNRDFLKLLTDASWCISDIYGKLIPKNKDAINRYFFFTKDNKGENFVQSVISFVKHFYFDTSNMNKKEIYVPEILDKATRIEDLVVLDVKTIKQNSITKEVFYRLRSVSGKDNNDKEI